MQIRFLNECTKALKLTRGMICVHGERSDWVAADFDVEATDEVINFLVDHFGEARCIEGDMRAPTLDYAYGPFAVGATIDQRRAVIFFRRHEVDGICQVVVWVPA
jgi:hypothetical protein